MEPIPKRIIIWTGVLFCVAFAVIVFRYCADRRGDWLVRAAWRGDERKVRLYLALGADVNSRLGGGTALHAAAHNGDLAMMQFLLDRGAAVDAKAKFAITPLWQARFSKQTAAEQLLIAHGANPDTSNINPP